MYNRITHKLTILTFLVFMKSIEKEVKRDTEKIRRDLRTLFIGPKTI